MARSMAADVSEYVAEASPARAPYLEQIRACCRSELPGYTEEMRWGMPVYARDGQVEFAFANQKGYISLYVMKETVAQQHAATLAGLDHGKGCIRFRRPETIDFDLVRALLRDTYASPTAPC